MLGQRGTFGWTMEKLGAENEKIIALSADLCNTSGLDRFANTFSDRFINTGIAEQNLVAVASGIADSGYVPFASTFANFATLRSCEMVRHFMGYMKCNVKLVGFGAGFAMEYFGNTHYGIEDVAAIRSVPNIVILSPADGMEVMKCTEAAAQCESPCYIRLTGTMNQAIVHKANFEFGIGQTYTLREGEDVLLLATGSMVAVALKASEKLSEDGIETRVVDVPTLKPFDFESVVPIGKEKLIVTVEEHSTVGGLGSIVAEAISKQGKFAPLLRLGVKEGYKKAGDYNYMLKQHGLTSEDICADIKNKLEEFK